MKNTTMLFIIMAMLFLVGGFVFVNGRASTNVVSNSGETFQGETQRIVLSQDDLNYKDAKAQADKPITISADSSVKGCLRSVVFNLDGKKYSKYLRNPEDTLQLPALSKGTYTYSCTMGMGFGKLIVG